MIGFYSKKLTPAEKNYTTAEKELFAVLQALEHFRTLVMGRKIQVYTDHRNLITQQPLDKSRAERWKVMLLEYDIELVHIAGKDNIMADYLSRSENYIYYVAKGTKKKKKLNKEEVRRIFLKKMKEAQNVQERVEIASNYFSHPGSTKLYTAMKEHWNEPGLKDAIEKNRKSCAICQRNSLGKAVVPKTQDLGQLSTTTPFEDIGSDVFRPFELPVRNKKYWTITITDRCTRWTQIRTTTKIDTTGIINALKIWITEHGGPKTFLHDQGTQYMAKETQDFLTSLDIRDVKTSPYNPTGNGISERINQEIGFVIT